MSLGRESMAASGGRKTAFSEEYENRPVGITVHTTADLHDRNGSRSEKTIVQYISQALNAAELNYEIDFDFPLKNPDIDGVDHGETPGKQNLYDWWRGQINNDPEFEPRKDSNILLSDRDSGGLGAVGGRVAVAPARHISDYEQHKWKGRGSNDQFRNTFATLHELSHNLGFTHSPHGGNAWNEKRKWHRTITVAASKLPRPEGRGIQRGLPF